MHGKAIHYARRRGVVTEAFGDWVRHRNATARQPAVADIPAIGTIVEASHPVCTAFAEGDCAPGVAETLRETLAVLNQLLESSPPHDTLA
jgi:predicted ATP-grasp superfamily ATP-dependent carboligase